MPAEAVGVILIRQNTASESDSSANSEATQIGLGVQSLNSQFLSSNVRDCLLSITSSLGYKHI